MLWGGLRQISRGTRLALFLPVRALDFALDRGITSLWVFASFAFWLAGGMLARFSGHRRFRRPHRGGLAEIPLCFGTCLLARESFGKNSSQ